MVVLDNALTNWSYYAKLGQQRLDKKFGTVARRFGHEDNGGSHVGERKQSPPLKSRAQRGRARNHEDSTMMLIRKTALALALLATATVAACDDDDDDVTGPGTTASVRVVHASPDAPNVDVLVDNTAALTNVAYKVASNYLAVPSGSRNLKVRATGTSTVVIDQTATLNQGAFYTVLATGRVASIAPVVLTDDQTSPASGNIRLRLVHASPTAGNVDIYVTTPTADLATAAATLSNVAFRASSSYLEVPAGTYRVRITPAGTKTVAIDVNNVALTAGQVRTAVAVDAVGGGAPLGAILLADKN